MSDAKAILRDYLWGMGSLFDYAGAFGPVSPYEGMDPATADRLALEADMRAVAGDMWDAIDRGRAANARRSREADLREVVG